ncbi:MAG: hypothetical protein A2452_12130 [Candidatus Firestonebacteria bacterium RIFOXYC2_FULL_39_67]|nr:MAG: hypothetical protein A2536_00205 [Candidatus Firestonebacteria bacterium RIFOXYD2_FULL_39_29]OGF55715.1 MAG: hypothetical protein A2452_12130 [Candidatus Firestonebacteria bacterium RIFOXYC2_FULL_39_67]OGF57968.1 MAG: hypothetical protein A2497_02405 [Candidatus Firestonebacteria bacterium RifOxyC12_full_39_7]
MKKDKILLIDDDEILKKEFKECFSEYEFLDAKNGEQALNIISKPNEIDLVILDVKMPGINGLEVLRKIKKNAPEVPVIIFTGYASKEVVLESLRNSADNLIEKPFDIEKSRDVIETLLAKIKKEPEDESLDTKGKINKAKKFLEKNFRKKTDLKDAAKVVALTAKYLSMEYKKITGVGFSEHRQQLRIDEAKEMLKNTGYSVDQISYKVGYENCESLIRPFKKSTGTTPAEYRKSKNKGKKKKR